MFLNNYNMQMRFLSPKSLFSDQKIKNENVRNQLLGGAALQNRVWDTSKMRTCGEVIQRGSGGDTGGVRGPP